MAYEQSSQPNQWEALAGSLGLNPDWQFTYQVLKGVQEQLGYLGEGRNLQSHRDKDGTFVYHADAAVFEGALVGVVKQLGERGVPASPTESQARLPQVEYVPYVLGEVAELTRDPNFSTVQVSGQDDLRKIIVSAEGREPQVSFFATSVGGQTVQLTEDVGNALLAARAARYGGDTESRMDSPYYVPDVA